MATDQRLKFSQVYLFYPEHLVQQKIASCGICTLVNEDGETMLIAFSASRICSGICDTWPWHLIKSIQQ